jgi:hypothetical protein
MQEQKTACANCGAELMAEAKFCRKCGQPTNALGRASVTEVTTRRLGASEQPFMPGQGVAGQQSLEQAASQTRSATATETRSLTHTSSTFKRWLPGLLIITVAVVIPLLYILSKWWQQPTIIRVERPKVEVPAPPKPPVPPAQSQPAVQGETKIDQSYFYPDARTTMVISKAGEGDVVQLQTADSVQKVTDWYTRKLKPEQVIKQAGNVVLKSGKLSVVIRPTGDGTSIMLTQDGD